MAAHLAIDSQIGWNRGTREEETAMNLKRTVLAALAACCVPLLGWAQTNTVGGAEPPAGETVPLVIGGGGQVFGWEKESLLWLHPNTRSKAAQLGQFCGSVGFVRHGTNLPDCRVKAKPAGRSRKTASWKPSLCNEV
jgi:hypothetical protein